MSALLPPTIPAEVPSQHRPSWLSTTDHKRIAILTGAVALLLLFTQGALALVMRWQLAVPRNDVLTSALYNQFYTAHGSGMIYLVIIPFAIAFGLYLVPLQIGAPNVAAPRTTMLGFWLYLIGAICILSGFATTNGAAKDGWTAYPPLASSAHSPGPGMDLWIVGVFLATLGMLLMGATVLWTALLKRAPNMPMLRMPIFTWSIIVTNLMVVGAFPAQLAATSLLAAGRYDPAIFFHNFWNIGYQHLFWFYAHPVVYVMFFPFLGAVADVLSTFARRRWFGYKATVVALLVFAAFSMSVWGHHMFTTGQVVNNYYSATSIFLLVPAGVEYFGMTNTVIRGRLRFPTPMLFALAFIPQFFIGGATGIMVGTPVLDYQAQDTYFVVAHFHYTLAAGSLFGLFAGFYFWFPKVTGRLLSEGLGKAHFWLMVVGVNVTFLPMFWSGVDGMPRRVFTYLPSDGISTPNLVSSIGAAILGIAMLVFFANLVLTAVRRRQAPDDPWEGQTLEWATSSPPPPLNFDDAHPVPPITSYAPLLDARERAMRQEPG